MNWYFHVLNNYIIYDGRAHREEYWLFHLFNTLIATAIYLVNIQIYGLYLLCVLLPSIAVGIRRMHDANHSGWWLLFPVVNLIFLIQESQEGENRFGPNPHEDKIGIAQSNSKSVLPSSFHQRDNTEINSIKVSVDVKPLEPPRLNVTPSELQGGNLEEIALSEEDLFEIIANELESGNAQKGLWIKLYSQCGGDETQTKVKYIGERIAQLRDLENQKLQKILNTIELDRKRALNLSAEKERLLNLLVPAYTASIADNFSIEMLQKMELHGITYEYNLYCYRDAKHDNLDDALNNAKYSNTFGI